MYSSKQRKLMQFAKKNLERLSKTNMQGLVSSIICRIKSRLLPEYTGIS